MAESLRDMRLFIAVYEELSFTAAAAREHATQSGVSQHIRKLEENLGVKLFSRGSGSVLPTPAGDSFYAGCVEMLRKHETLRRKVQQFGSSLDGEIMIGLMPTMTRCTLAPALVRFSEAHPNVVARIVEAYSSALTLQIRSGELAFAIVPAMSTMVGLKSHLFLRTPELLVSGRRSGFAHLSPVRPADLGPLKLVVPSKLNTRRSRIETYLTSNGVQIERRLELDSMFGTIDYVAKTDWVTVLPATMMVDDIKKRELTVNALVEPPLTLDLVVIEPSRTLMAPAAVAFLEILREETTLLNQRISEIVLPRESKGRRKPA